jgi:hypothetical protein
VEFTQPNRSKNQQEHPDRQNDEELFDATHFAKESETVSVENRGANDGLQQIARQSHPAD